MAYEHYKRAPKQERKVATTYEGWERECIRVLDISTYAIDGCDAECIQESVYTSILLLKKKRTAARRRQRHVPASRR